MKKRVLSALLIAIVLIPILIIGGIVFNVTILLIGLAALKEFLDIRESKKKFPFLIKFITYLLFTVLLLSNTNQVSLIINLDYKLIALIIFLFLIPLIYFKNNKIYNINDVMFLIGTVFFLGLAFNLIITIRNYDILYLIYLLLITVITDTFAYITGYYIGKTPLLSEFSPHKTWEGLIGGTFFGVLISSLFFLTIISGSIGTIILVFITVLLSLLGQIGDLVFSSVKRYYGKKDFSNLIPGHGGVLDRLDSTLFVILGFSIVISLFNL